MFRVIQQKSICSQRSIKFQAQAHWLAVNDVMYRKNVNIIFI